MNNFDSKSSWLKTKFVAEVIYPETARKWHILLRVKIELFLKPLQYFTVGYFNLEITHLLKKLGLKFLQVKLL